MKMTKRIFCCLLVICLVFTTAPAMVWAAGDGVQTTLDISKGSITIGNGTVSGYGTDGTEVTTADEDGYIIVQTTSDALPNYIHITGGIHNITLDNVNLKGSQIIDATEAKTIFGSTYANELGPFIIYGNAAVKVVLKGTNTLTSSVNAAGLEVFEGSSVTIKVPNGEADDYGKLTATGNSQAAGIGGSRWRNAGEITILSGTIDAKCYGAYASGIGPGRRRSIESIMISGGIITNRCGNSAGRYNYSLGTAEVPTKVAALTITGGVIDTNGIAGTTVEISGGTIKASKTNPVEYSTLSVTGGNIIAASGLPATDTNGRKLSKVYVVNSAGTIQKNAEVEVKVNDGALWKTNTDSSGIINTYLVDDEKVNGTDKLPDGWLIGGICVCDTAQFTNTVNTVDVGDSNAIVPVTVTGSVCSMPIHKSVTTTIKIDSVTLEGSTEPVNNAADYATYENGKLTLKPAGNTHNYTVKLSATRGGDGAPPAYHKIKALANNTDRVLDIKNGAISVVAVSGTDHVKYTQGNNNYTVDKDIPVTISDTNNNKTVTIISSVDVKPFIVAKSEDGAKTYNLVWNLNKDDNLYYTSLTVPKNETVRLIYEGYAPAVTYKQISGKAETKNNDPLLVIGTVTGDEDFRPEGRLFYMFSGNLAGQESNFQNNTEAMQAYGEGLTRVMDSSAAFDAAIAAGSSAATTYNGYSDLQDADITFAADADKMDISGNWTDIPDELLDVPVRISLGQDVTKYYTDYTDNTFTGETDEANAAYRVDYTYEYTTRADNNGNAIKLGDLLSGTGDYEMSYSDVAVYTKNSSEWVSAAGYSTSNVLGLAETVNYEFSGKFDDIKAAVLGYINDNDTANDFWNHAGSSFGLYVTYEYIAPNVCLSRYVPVENTDYLAAYSAASLLVPGAETADFTYKVYKQTEGTWTELTSDGGKYVVDYDDSIMITTKDAANYDGTTPNYNVAVQNDTFAFTAGTADDATAAFTFTPSDGDNEVGFEGLVTIRRAYDGTYAQVDKQFTLVINQRADAQTPGITLPAKAAVVIEGSGSVSGIIEAEATVIDGGSLTYQWYEVNEGNETAINGQTGLSLDLAQTTIAAGESKVYRIKVTNTNNGASINGDNVTTSHKDIDVSIISTAAGGSIEGEAIVYADGVAVTLPADTAASVDNEGNITLSGGATVGTVEIPAGAGNVKIPVGSLSEVAEDGENVVLPAGSVVSKDGTTHNMPNGGKLNKNGDVITATGAGFGGGVSEQRVTIKNDGEGVTAKLESYGTKLTITVEEGYELVDVTVNGVSKGAVTSLSRLRSGDVVEIFSQKAGAGSSGGGTLSVVDVESLLAKLTPVARSSRTAKNNVKIVTNLDEVDEAIIRQIENAGYTIKYNYYRSTQKSSKYKSMYIPKSTTYINTMGAKGTMYYYKTRIQVYDINGELVARTELKQCKYANRRWNR